MRKGVLILAAILAVSAASRVDTLVFAPWTSSSHSELMEAAYLLLTTFMHSEFFAVEGERDMFAFLEEAGMDSIVLSAALQRVYLRFASSVAEITVVAISFCEV